jgi:hypothetical protein
MKSLEVSARVSEVWLEAQDSSYYRLRRGSRLAIINWPVRRPGVELSLKRRMNRATFLRFESLEASLHLKREGREAWA